MPITKRRFELGIDEEVDGLMRQIYDLLASHKDLAYSYDELRQAILGARGVIFVTKESKFQRAIEALAELGAAEKREIAGSSYLAYSWPYDTETWERKFEV